MSRYGKTGLRGFQTGLTQTKLYKDKRWLEAGSFCFRKKRHCTIRVAKNKVTAKLICAFVFAIADGWFSHMAAHLLNLNRILIIHELYKFSIYVFDSNF